MSYYVWRRGDGYVDATTYDPRRPGSDKRIDQFAILQVTDDWPAAQSMIEVSRDARHDATVASWDQPRQFDPTDQMEV